MTFTMPEKADGLTYAAGDVICHVGAPNVNAPTGLEALDTIVGSDYRNLGWQDVSGYLFKLDVTTKEIPAAGTLTSIRTVITGGSKTTQVTCLEALNPYVRALFDDVPVFPVATSPLKPATGTVASYVLPDPPGDNRYACVFDSVDGDKLMRLYCPNSKVTARGDEQVQQSDITTVQLTFTHYPGTIDSVTGIAKRYIDYGDGVTMTDYFTAAS